MYFLINCDEDGEVSICEYTKKELLEVVVRLQDFRTEYFKKPGGATNPQYWEGKVLIIKGEIVAPKAIKVIEEFDID